MAKKPKNEGVFQKAAHVIADAITGAHDDQPAAEETETVEAVDAEVVPEKDRSSEAKPASPQSNNQRKFDKFK